MLYDVSSLTAQNGAPNCCDQTWPCCGGEIPSRMWICQTWVVSPEGRIAVFCCLYILFRLILPITASQAPGRWLPWHITSVHCIVSPQHQIVSVLHKFACCITSMSSRVSFASLVIYSSVSSVLHSKRSWDSVVGIATACGLDDQGFGVRVLVGSRIFSSPRRPDWLWVQPNFLSNGYRRLFPRG
jgi:hypothetical protein